MKSKALTLALLAFAPQVAGVSPLQAAERMVIPIHATERYGITHYEIEVRIGGVPVEALLDSGSTGLYVLADAVQGQTFEQTGRQMHTGYSNGQRLQGDIAIADLSFADGSVQQKVPIGLIQDINCDPANKRCTLPPEQRKTGDILGKGAFQAIIGVSMPSATLKKPIPNPLTRFADSWILDLPRPGHKEGQIILNPSAEEVAGFKRFPAGTGPNVGGGRDNPIPGCLTIAHPARRYCGPIVLDSGNPVITVITDEPQHRLPPGTPVTMAFGPDEASQLKAGFTVGRAKGDSTTVLVGPFPYYQQPPTRVLIGVEVYKHFAVLYDEKNAEIGLKPF
ncbi:hypothetical protein [Rhizobium paknamense]|uniref:Aspartyl protease n=1 Tax=Rhizobium paknamense TaxID=1206817 RepID=A0ABU0IDW3_9HYPH|nr:hypothetical protein [Rhizobium paknamense]MDQ0455630.1 hypothetical protein [Rhizobium paknamense]